MGGRTGLQYLVLFELLDRSGIAGEEWQQMFQDIRVLECGALEVMRDSN